MRLCCDFLYNLCNLNIFFAVEGIINKKIFYLSLLQVWNLFIKKYSLSLPNPQVKAGGQEVARGQEGVARGQDDVARGREEVAREPHPSLAAGGGQAAPRTGAGPPPPPPHLPPPLHPPHYPPRQVLALRWWQG